VFSKAMQSYKDAMNAIDGALDLSLNIKGSD